MDIERIREIKKVAQKVYTELPNQKYRLQLLDMIELSRFDQIASLIPNLYHEIMRCCDNKADILVLCSYLFLDWGNVVKQEDLKQWLLSRTGRGGLLKVSSIEEQAGIPANTLKHWLAGRQGLAEHHLQPLTKVLEKVGYKPD